MIFIYATLISPVVAGNYLSIICTDLPSHLDALTDRCELNDIKLYNYLVAMIKISFLKKMCNY